MSGLWQDLRYGVRTLVRTPGFFVAGVVSLALAIAANTIVFGVLNALMLRPLSIKDPEQVFFVQEQNSGGISFPFYRELRDRSTLLSGLAGCRIAPMTLQSTGGSERVWGYLATGNYFDVLGVQPALGRFFHADDDRVPRQAPYAVLSYASWRNRFGGDSNIIGRTIRIKGLPFTVLGVAPEGFRGTELFYVPEIWVPMMMQPHIEEFGWLDNWRTGNTWVLGRTQSGVTRQQAEEHLRAITQTVAKEQSWDSPPRLSLTRPGLAGDTLRTPAEAFSLGLMLLAALVLLAASVNLATLFVVRSHDRMREMGIKLALGAARGRLARELTFEVLSVALIGGMAGLALAAAALTYLANWRIPVDVPIQVDVQADYRVLLFAVGAAGSAGLLAATSPLWRIWQADPQVSLRRHHDVHRTARWSLRDVLLAVQVACCCVLLTAGVVSLRALAGALSTDVAMDMDRVTVAGFDLGLAGYSRAAGRDLQQRVLEAAASMPAVTSAALGSSAPLYIDHSSTAIYPEHVSSSAPPVSRSATYYLVSPNFFRTLGTRLMRGADFSRIHDDRAAPVAIVNETLARQIGTRDGIGWRLRSGCPTCDPIEVIGIVEDGKYQTLAESARPVIFFPLAQRHTLSTLVLVRSDRSQSDIAARLREAIHGLDRDLPLYSLGGLDDAVAFVLVPAWAGTLTLNAFGLLASLLIVTGVYGMAAYSVSRRSREIGIRSAIGAQPWQILRAVLGRTAVLLIIGASTGLVLGFAATRVLQHVVYQATPQDPVVLVVALVVVSAIGVGAASLPARRALRIDPVRALRDE